MAEAFSRLALFNRLTPKDRGGRLVARAVPYGPDPRQRLDVYAPVALGGRPAPVVVFFYGGNWDSGDMALYRWVGRALAARGFLTVVPNYRLVPRHRFPDFVEDGARAVAKARDLAIRHHGDPDRLALMGHSAGAYIAVLLALDARYLRPQDLAAVHAVVGLAGPYDFLPFDVAASVNAFGHAPDPEATQPIRYARGDAAPMLLAHGDQDTVVAPRHSIDLHREIRSRGGAVELKMYPGRDHVDLVLPLSRLFRRRIPLLDDVTRFLHARLG
jgi:acetyl esterase/lipase